MSDAQGGDGGKPSDAVGDSSIGPFGDKVNEKFNVGDAVEMLVHDGVFAKVSSGVGTEREPQPCSFRRLASPALPSPLRLLTLTPSSTSFTRNNPRHVIALHVIIHVIMDLIWIS